MNCMKQLWHRSQSEDFILHERNLKSFQSTAFLQFFAVGASFAVAGTRGALARAAQKRRGQESTIG